VVWHHEKANTHAPTRRRVSGRVEAVPRPTQRHRHRRERQRADRRGRRVSGDHPGAGGATGPAASGPVGLLGRWPVVDAAKVMGIGPVPATDTAPSRLGLDLTTWTSRSSTRWSLPRGSPACATGAGSTAPGAHMPYPMLFTGNRSFSSRSLKFSQSTKAQVNGQVRRPTGNAEQPQNETEGLLVRVQSREPSSQVSGHVDLGPRGLSAAVATPYPSFRSSGLGQGPVQGFGCPAAWRAGGRGGRPCTSHGHTGAGGVWMSRRDR
jgi:hypothetical protein